MTPPSGVTVLRRVGMVWLLVAALFVELSTGFLFLFSWYLAGHAWSIAGLLVTAIASIWVDTKLVQAIQGDRGDGSANRRFGCLVPVIIIIGLFALITWLFGARLSFGP